MHLSLDLPIPHLEMYLKDKIEAIWQYYDCAGFDIKSEQDLFVFLGI